MSEDENVKSFIVGKYDGEAEEKDNPQWMEKGKSVRVPESTAAHYFIDRKVEMALKLSPPEPGLRVHEIGCSFGHMTSLLARKFDHLIASDISPKSVEIAAERFRHYGIDNVDFVVADAENMPQFKDEEFDRVYSFSTIRFCPNPDRAMAEIFRSMKSGGTLVVDFPNRVSPWHVLIKAISGINKHEHDNLYTKRTAVQLVEDAGFVNVEAVEFLFTTKRLPKTVLPIFKLADRVLEKTPLRRLAGIIMIRARKS
ncbi:class I SAM-dependent methyltransferase [bacterium]|nr:class I SAM-dependent methyltransferase [bacterium]